MEKQSRRAVSQRPSAYCMLLGTIVAVNVFALILHLVLNLPVDSILSATAINLFLSVLVRQEDLITFGFSLVAKVPPKFSLRIRRLIADFHHYGGVHAGCAMSACLWHILFVVANTRICWGHAKDGTITNWEQGAIVTSYGFLFLILVISLTTLPSFRERFHNCFERTHRFAGWAVLIVLWIHVGIHTVTTAKRLYQSPTMWLLAGTTGLVILPWVRIRCVPITAQPLSSREIRLTFPYANMPYTSTSRFSLSPLMEWHAFATIPDPDGDSADIIVSAAGDWTQAIVDHPPRRLWIRKPAVANFLASTLIFNSILLVATGAGIGPMLSLFASPAMSEMKAQRRKMCIMWCVGEADAPHWTFVQTALSTVDPAPKIFDSKRGRCDVAFEARRLACFENVEAVFVVSNRKVTREVIHEVNAYGIAAFGAVFDS